MKEEITMPMFANKDDLIKALYEKIERLENRYKWLSSQHWVESEAVFRLGLSDDENLLTYWEELDCAIDKKLKG